MTLINRSVESPDQTRRISFVRLETPREQAKRLFRSVIAYQKPASRSPELKQKTQRRKSLAALTSRSRSGSESINRAGMRSSMNSTLNGLVNRPNVFEQGRSVSDTQSGNMARVPSVALPGVDLSQKPVAQGSGVTVSINLAEPALFIQGFEANDMRNGNTAMLRGTLHLRVIKSAKIKAVTLKFKGKATTKWPEGIPPRKTEFEEIDNIMNHTWTFFNAQFPTAEAGTCADQVELFAASEMNSKNAAALSRSPNLKADGFYTPGKDNKRLSLQINQSRSFGKGDTSSGPTIASKGYRTFHPGDYVYNFELPLDSRLPETIDVELGNVKYELEAVIERAGAFKTNLVGTKEVQLIRIPAEGSLEHVEPIAISRTWEDQLHYDIVISGKSFPLGSQVPMAFKLTPLAKVNCHRIKVMVTENIEYFCHGKRVHRMEPTRKLQLFEKRSDAPPTSTYPGSTMRITAGGGVAYDARAQAANGDTVPGSDPSNLLGDLRDDAAIVGPTELEFNVQLPDCASMKDKERSQRLHFDTTYTNIQVHHWIKIILRLSKQDENDPTKRRHFEISIDSPFHILSCRADQSNTSLPAYNQVDALRNPALYECGCPNAAPKVDTQASFFPTLYSLNTGDTQRPAPASQLSQMSRPGTSDSSSLATTQRQSSQEQVRPIHLLRKPSFNPPPFDYEAPPPPMSAEEVKTPPPSYSSIASPTHGLADYFVRLGNTYDDDDDEGVRHGRGRVEVPLTPGSARVNRSMEIVRGWVPLDAHLS